MARKGSHNSSSRKRLKNSDNDDSRQWSDLDSNLLFLVMMQLGVVDFIAFSGVCKHWRSVAHKDMNVFMTSRQPVRMSISNLAKKVCLLDDLKGRKFKTILPYSPRTTCVGLTCGYLIMFRKRTHDFWLVNPITRHEICFPTFPLSLDPYFLNRVRGVLVFSSSLSRWVFVISVTCTETISLCFTNKQASWFHLRSKFTIYDLHVFNGKIYTINAGGVLCELRLHPRPGLTPLKMKNELELGESIPFFLSSNEKLYVMGRVSSYKYTKEQEVDFEEMKWVPVLERKDVVFVSDLKCSVAAKPVGFGETELKTPRVLDTYRCRGRGKDSTIWYLLH